MLSSCGKINFDSLLHQSFAINVPGPPVFASILRSEKDLYFPKSILGEYLPAWNVVPFMTIHLNRLQIGSSRPPSIEIVYTALLCLGSNVMTKLNRKNPIKLKIRKGVSKTAKKTCKLQRLKS